MNHQLSYIPKQEIERILSFEIDIDTEITNHKLLETWLKNHETIRTLESTKSKNEMAVTQAKKQIEKIVDSLKTMEQPICPTCEQPITDEKHQHLLEDSKHKEQKYKHISIH